jgi:hypothetical protein
MNEHFEVAGKFFANANKSLFPITENYCAKEEVKDLNEYVYVHIL